MQAKRTTDVAFSVRKEVATLAAVSIVAVRTLNEYLALRDKVEHMGAVATTVVDLLA